MSKQRKTQKMSDKIERAIHNGWRRGLGPVGDWSRKSKKLTER